jgi:hypothetical protein
VIGIRTDHASWGGRVPELGTIAGQRGDLDRTSPRSPAVHTVDRAQFAKHNPERVFA